MHLVICRQYGMCVTKPTYSFLLFAAVLSFANVGAKEHCISGVYHKKIPAAENDLKECYPWKSLTCCTSSFTADLAQNQTRNLYNHTWHRCKKLSSACERYWLNQECFYQCSPFISKWEDAKIKGAVTADNGLPSRCQPPIQKYITILNRSCHTKQTAIIINFAGIPICASVCDRWYEACKADEICVENVISDYNFTEHGENFCPSNKPCVTYEKMYGSGKALCEKMWAPSYKYVKENQDSTNCMVMWFDGKNPNKDVTFTANVTSGSAIFRATCIQLLFLPLLTFVILA